MLNIFSVMCPRTAIADAAAVTAVPPDFAPPMRHIAPGDIAPIVRIGAGRRMLALARWGMPAPAIVLRGRSSDPGATCVRNARSLHWSRWLAVEHRCVVPFTGFAAGARLPDGSTRPVWLAVESRPLAWFAAIWTTWASPERLREHGANCDRFAIVTCDANRELAVIGCQTMPVVLRDHDELDRWLSAPTSLALELQRPLADGSLTEAAGGPGNDMATPLADAPPVGWRIPERAPALRTDGATGDGSWAKSS